MKLLEKAINNFNRKKVLIVGDLILDKFSWGSVRRINPEQPAAQLIDIDEEKYILGGAGNVATNITSLGGKATLFCEIGNDFYKKEIESLCKNNSIELEKIIAERPNIIKQRFMAHGQQLIRADYGEKNIQKTSKETQEEIISRLDKIIPNYDTIILSDYNKTFFAGEIAQEIIKKAEKNGIKTIADFKPENAKMFEGCSYLCPNRSEAEKISGIKIKERIEENDWKEITRRIYNEIHPQAVIVTCSEEGVFAYDFIAKKEYIIPTRARKVADVTGAGDTFAAAFALGISDLNLKYSLELANYAAGIVVEKPGTATTSKSELINALYQSRNL